MEVCTHEQNTYQNVSFTEVTLLDPVQVYHPVLSQGSAVSGYAASVENYSTLAAKKGVICGRFWWNLSWIVYCQIASQQLSNFMMVNFSWVIGKASNVEGLPDFSFNPFYTQVQPAENDRNPWNPNKEDVRILWSYSLLIDTNPNVWPVHAATSGPEYLATRRRLKGFRLRELEALYFVVTWACETADTDLLVKNKYALHCAIPWKLI